MANQRRRSMKPSDEVLAAIRALGSIGGKLRWKGIPHAARTAHAKKAAAARWAKKRKRR